MVGWTMTAMMAPLIEIRNSGATGAGLVDEAGELEPAGHDRSSARRRSTTGRASTARSARARGSAGASSDGRSRCRVRRQLPGLRSSAGPSSWRSSRCGRPAPRSVTSDRREPRGDPTPRPGPSRPVRARPSSAAARAAGRWRPARRTGRAIDRASRCPVDATPIRPEPEREDRVLVVARRSGAACRRRPGPRGWPGPRTGRGARPAGGRPAHRAATRPRASARRPRCRRGRGSDPARGTSPAAIR